MRHLPRPFYHRPVVEVARDLLGKTLVFNGIEGIITETEAYGGRDDPASHAYPGPTPRSAIMFGPPGFSYVYLIYGMYHCLNIVTDAEGTASAVLIRGLQLPALTLDGPGKICRHLGITRTHGGLDLTENMQCYVQEGIVPQKIEATPRIGIKKATDKLWRFTIDEKI